MKYYLGKAKSLMTIRFLPKRKKKKRKNPQKTLNPFPLIHLEMVNINFSFEGLTAL
jgi:hypothetical protein